MKTNLLLLTAVLISGTVHAEFRTWTRTDGKTAELELTETSGVDGEKTGRFKMRNGNTVDLPAEGFVEADAELINSWKPEPSAESLAAGPSVFDEILDGNLEKLDGKSLKRYELEQKPTKYYLFYYTASWCPPCQKFTPDLVEFYDKNKPKSVEFEIVLVTSDSDEKAMEGYAKDKKMQWPHLKLSKVKSFKSKFPHPGGGIPNLVLTDLEGNLIKTSYVDGKYTGPSPVMNHLDDLLK
ncbi:MAG: thioredoxin-like domain-containing protein [Luteolibacter sp.]